MASRMFQLVHMHEYKSCFSGMTSRGNIREVAQVNVKGHLIQETVKWPVSYTTTFIS